MCCVPTVLCDPQFYTLGTRKEVHEIKLGSPETTQPSALGPGWTPVLSGPQSSSSAELAAG